MPSRPKVRPGAEPCSVEGCSRLEYCKGFCHLHYYRVVRTGTPHPKPGKTTRERFMDKITKSDSGCWIWNGSVADTGYGTFKVSRGKWAHAHRFSYEIHIGPLEDDQHLDHICRVLRCCNPDHLEPVAPRTNFLRGIHPNALAVRFNRCKRGHDISDAYVIHRSNGRVSRQCRMCRKNRENRARGGDL